MTPQEERDAVLEAFAAEPAPDDALLRAYLERHPAWRWDLIELACLREHLVETDDPLTERDEQRIEEAWLRMKKALGC